MASKTTDEIQQHHVIVQGNEMEEGDAIAAVDKQVLDDEYSYEEKLEDTEDNIFDRTGKKIVFGDKDEDTDSDNDYVVDTKRDESDDSKEFEVEMSVREPIDEYN